MKRTCIPLLVVVALATAGVALAASRTGATIKLGNTSVGKILTKKSGFTIYVFTRDGRNKDRCVHVNGCTGTWPPVTTKGKPVAGAGVKASLLGTTKLPNGSKQVTYNGHPLYGYVADFQAGQTDYVGTPQFGGTWEAINAAGKFVK